MGISHRIGVAVITAALAAGAGAGHAGGPPQPGADPPVDEELLEFLGSVDSPADSTQQSGDEGWLAYLSHVDFGKVAKSSQAPAPAQPKPAKAAANPGKPEG
ncbi:MAG TPA: hypothetical protein VFP94_03010 [Terriglobales bacterium]|nr:hypothetical protein [Terriglobales bacterium]